MNKINEKLALIQKELKAPKGQYNDFGKYSYRSCEDILEAVKPLLDGVTLIIDDEIINVGERYYVKATVTISDGENVIKSSAFARESFDKKGMDDAQITGATSSYARKYALNGLFAIDDTKDADTMDNRQAARTNKSSISKVTANMANVGNGACVECHAPAGKNHATSCSLGRGEQAKTIGHTTEPM